jgi:hypothetical protein
MIPFGKHLCVFYNHVTVLVALLHFWLLVLLAGRGQRQQYL